MITCTVIEPHYNEERYSFTCGFMVICDAFDVNILFQVAPVIDFKIGFDPDNEAPMFELVVQAFVGISIMVLGGNDDD